MMRFRSSFCNATYEQYLVRPLFFIRGSTESQPLCTTCIICTPSPTIDTPTCTYLLPPDYQ